MKLNSFKIYSKTKSIKEVFPLKILKFKRAKWLKIKKNFAKTLNRKKFSNTNKIKIRFLSYKRKKQNFKNNLKSKQLLYQIFLDSFNFKLFRKIVLSEKKRKNIKLNVLLSLFLKIEYRIDVALSKLFFFSSLLEARNYIKNGNVLVNNKKVVQNYFLKEGDVVQIKNDSLNSTKKILSRNKKTSYFHTFFEIDYYTKTFIVLKNFINLSNLDTSLFLYEVNNLLQIYRIVTKK